MFTHFFESFEVHHIMIFRYNVCLEEHMDLLLKLISGITLENTKLMKRIEEWE